jgi:hypothetical protein
VKENITLMNFKSVFLIIFSLLLILIAQVSFAQCSGGTNAGSLTPTSTMNTISISSGEYRTFSAVQGNRYIFSFCSADGGSASYNSHITMAIVVVVPHTIAILLF